jgi:chemotaxis protein methyltransferase CheR
VKYFNKEDDSWRISKDILSMVKFERVNLLDDFSHLGKFDVIFLRNVLIYFSMDTKKDILDRVAARCASDGILILGAAETTLGITETFLPLRESRGLYRRNPNAPAKGR